MFTVYVLKSLKDGRRYIGQTRDWPRRWAEHQNPERGFTKGRGPYKVVLTEEYAMRQQAVLRERFLKSGHGREYLNSLK